MLGITLLCTMPPKKSTKLSDESEELMNAIKDIKKDILLDSENKNGELLQKIGELDTKLSNTLNLHGERLSNLETFQTTTCQNLGDLRRDLVNVDKDVTELSQKLQDNISHSRRLNLDFLGFKEESDFASRRSEEVIPKLRNFWVNTLRIPEQIAQSILVRDAHRIGKYDAEARYSRVIKCGFVTMEHRNLIMKNAYKCKNTDYAVRVDLIKELVPIQQQNLKIRSDIKEVNPEALASAVIRNFKPVLLVKYRGKVQEFNPRMKFEDLQPGDRH